MNKLTFIDLYAGIGGIRFGFESVGAKCLFSSEWNKFAKITYEAFHGDVPVGDISLVDIEEDIPEHDILTAGFPCQPFSLAGVSKKNSLGRAHGFDDPTQGTEFFRVKEILKAKKPKAFLLENVKNLKSHDNKKTFKIIEEQLDTVGYDFKSFIVDSAHWLPQHRERIFIVGFRKDLLLKSTLSSLEIQLPKKRLKNLSSILLKEEDVLQMFGNKYTLTPGTWNALQRHKRNHQAKGNGFGFGLVSPPFDTKTTRTMSARYYKDGGEILIEQEHSEIPRKILPLEACRLQGFPKKCEKFLNGEYQQPVSDVQFYKQFGNSVSVPVIKMFAKIITDNLRKSDRAGEK
ncbi:DNA (cytosine-5-)-methyltransferase [Salinimicrobium terrae]|uniref:DNA (cytosine-5-)-methyltransferase n=1 Tax=Salinimicrobium terrae TaxID=470866 RepID=UPI000411A2C7|nr:DNA (cytosine-5-)-methyltransferase [Salinimicrobium terrae]